MLAGASLPIWFELLFAALFGLVFGSFATVLTARIPNGISIVTPPSACPNCGHRLAWHENLPLLGYLLAGGRCRSCRQLISARYPFTEAITASLFVGSVWRTGLSGPTFALLALAVLTMPLVWIDLDLKRLPNPLTAALTAAAGLAALATAALQSDLSVLTSPVVCALAGGGGFLLLNLLSRGGMGMGDVKLVFGLGLALGLSSWRVFATGIALAFLIGGVVGILLLLSKRGGRKTQIPFGPYLLLGAWLSVLAGPPLQDAVLRLWGL